MFFLALSCLQGRPIDRAFAELALPGVDGIQLTPGCHPVPGFEDKVRSSGLAIRTHHGFAFRATRKRDVWGTDGACLVDSDSVHPPRADAPGAARFLDGPTPILETMYPGWGLPDGAALDAAMARRLPLAVDVSHLHIQRAQGCLSDATLARVLDYDNIAEVHVSANDGRRDLHAPLRADSFGLAWVRAKLASTPVILECYFHQLARAERLAQIDLVLAGN